MLASLEPLISEAQRDLHFAAELGSVLFPVLLQHHVKRLRHVVVLPSRMRAI